MTAARLASPLGRAAWVAAAAHLGAALLARRFVLPAVPAEPLAERLAWVAGAGWGWRLAWLAWIPAGLTILAVLALARRRLPGSRPATAALAAGAAAVAADAPCDVAQAWLLPRLAAADPAAFVAAERWLVLGGYTVANGLYSLATLLLTWAVARRRGPTILASGLPLAAAGLWLAAAGAAGAYAHTAPAAALTLGLCLVWPLHLAWLLAPAGGAAPSPAGLGAGASALPP